MTEKFENKNLLSDEELVAMFFDENRQELADEGFSHQVMHRLPTRSVRLNRIWTALCSVVGIVFFILFDGFGQLKHLALTSLGNFESFLNSIELNGMTILMILAALWLFAAVAAWNLAEDRDVIS
ncbi:MAG: DUF5056 domain-containing protein [Prevotella sp.]|nr:DUF5056 domain-containing protein [Prevotella sp.]